LASCQITSDPFTAKLPIDKPAQKSIVGVGLGGIALDVGEGNRVGAAVAGAVAVGKGVLLGAAVSGAVAVGKGVLLGAAVANAVEVGSGVLLGIGVNIACGVRKVVPASSSPADADGVAEG
jgi:hypothetical protein